MNQNTTETKREVVHSVPAETAIAMVERRGHQLIEQVLGAVGTSCLHNFPGSKIDQWKMIARAEGGDILTREDIGCDVFNMKYFYAHQIRMVNDSTGEISEPTRIVLFDADLNAVSFVSDGIAKSLARIIQTFGIGPYDPPIQVKVQEFKTNKKRRMYTLVPA